MKIKNSKLKKYQYYLWLVLMLTATFIGCSTRTETGTVVLNNTTIMVEIVDTYFGRARGLSGRESLAADQGMLFVWPQAGTYTFWMKEMKFPIDIIWIKDNQVIEIVKNAPVPTNGQPIPTFTPQQQADKVLEVQAGLAEKNQVKVGDLVESIIN